MTFQSEKHEEKNHQNDFCQWKIHQCRFGSQQGLTEDEQWNRRPGEICSAAQLRQCQCPPRPIQKTGQKSRSGRCPALFSNRWFFRVPCSLISSFSGSKSVAKTHYFHMIVFSEYVSHTYTSYWPSARPISQQTGHNGIHLAMRVEVLLVSFSNVNVEVVHISYPYYHL